MYEYYIPMLNDKGIMFIEDVQKIEDFDRLEERFNEVTKTLEGKYLSEKIDLRHIKDRYDDLIFCMKRVDE